MTPHPPGAEVWVAPDPGCDDDPYSFTRAVIVKWSDWLGEYFVTTPSGRHMVLGSHIFATEADARADRKRQAGQDLNHHKAKAAAAEAYLGRP